MAGFPDTSTDIVIFGASGDLTRRKILPALRGVVAEASGSRGLAR